MGSVLNRTGVSRLQILLFVPTENRDQCDSVYATNVEIEGSRVL